MSGPEKVVSPSTTLTSSRFFPNPAGFRFHAFKPNLISLPANIEPGFYIFVQDKHTKLIYALPSQSGHGHPFLANLVNKILHHKPNDFSWLGAAGEKVIGSRTILGYSFYTGFFHEMLDLTETTEPHPLSQQQTELRIKQTHLPTASYFPVHDWDGMFNKGYHLKINYFGVPKNIEKNHVYLYLHKNNLELKLQVNGQIKILTVNNGMEQEALESIKKTMREGKPLTLLQKLTIASFLAQKGYPLNNRSVFINDHGRFETLDAPSEIKLTDMMQAYPPHHRVMLDKILATMNKSLEPEIPYAGNKTVLRYNHSLFFKKNIASHPPLMASPKAKRPKAHN